MFLFQFPSTLLQSQNGMLLLIPQLMAILMLTEAVFVIIKEMLHGTVYINFMLQLLVLKFVSPRWN